MKELAFNVRSGQRLVPFSITATLQPEGVLEPLQVERGDRVAFVANGGTPRQVLLARKTCKRCQPALLWKNDAGARRMRLDGLQQHPEDIEEIALDAGYRSAAALYSDIEKRFQLPFSGTLMRW